MQASDVVAQLLASEVWLPSMAQPPIAPGFYAWWLRREHLAAAIPPVPYETRTPASADWSLLYVGISPSGPSSRRNIAIRFSKDHVGGRIGSSTFRKSVAALMMEALKLQPLGGRGRACLVSETPLSRWIGESCGVTFASVERPWDLEADVIKRLDPPLNIDNGAHPFRLEVKARRAALMRACGL